MAYGEKNPHASGREYDRKNYHLKLSMAKEICMLARTVKGKKVKHKVQGIVYKEYKARGDR